MQWSDMDKPVARPIWWSVLGGVTILCLALLLNSFNNLQRELQHSAVLHDSQLASLAATKRSEQASSGKKEVLQKVSELEDSNRIIVKYKERDLPPGLSIAAERANIEKAQGLKRLFAIESIGAEVYEINGDDTAPEAVQRLRAAHKNVIEYAEVDAVVYPTYTVNDPQFSSQWHLAKTDAATAWDTALGNAITVATIDSGADMDHPDLAGSLVAGTNIVDGTKNVDDTYGHGTAVAGMMTAIVNNALGVVGVAPQAKNLVIKVGDGSSYMSYLARGVTFAADNGARVANLSWSGACNNLTVQNAASYMRSKGGVVVVSAGNTGSDLGGTNSSAVVCAGATNSADGKAWFSSFGTYVDVSAPGEGVYLTSNGGGYGGWSGTSFSAPFVAAAYALVFSANPSLTPAEADNIIFSTAQDLGDTGWDSNYGHGRVNLAKAVAMARGAAGTQDTSAPSAPQNLRSTTVSTTGITLTWAAATDNVGVTGYQVYRNGSQVATISGTSFTDTGLAPQTQYAYVVKAVDKAGNQSGESNKVTVTTAAPEFQIVSYSVPTKTSNSATVQTELSATGAVTVRYGTSAGALNQTAQSASSSAQHTVEVPGLMAATTYYYQVVATDGVGKAISSTISSFKTAKASGGGSSRGKTNTR